jgi:hypothetical protein
MWFVPMARRSIGWSRDVELAKNYRLSRAQLKEIEQLIEDHRDEIKHAWKKHFG